MVDLDKFVGALEVEKYFMAVTLSDLLLGQNS